jgi:L-proline amide hydrolase
MTAARTGAATEATMVLGGRRTWYRVVGDLDGDRTPVVVCHGGPGITHDYLGAVAGLSRSGRPCLLYDQFGCGRSGRRPDAPAGFWTVDLFVRELLELTEHLGIADGYHVVGHSWGGMLALESALRHPPGLRSIVAADTFASAQRYAAEVARLVGELPVEVRGTIERHEAAGTTDAPEYQEAVRVFYRRHVCRRQPVPDEVRRTLAALAADGTVYQAMMGPSEFRLSGSLRDWDITDRLAEIDVPVLLVSGRYDEVTPAAVQPLCDGLRDVHWVLFEESSHMPHVEETARFLDVVEHFLDQVDGPGAVNRHP